MRTVNFENVSYESNVEFVVTIPSELSPYTSYKLDARTTMGVIVELIIQSTQYLTIAFPFVQHKSEMKNPSIFVALEKAIKRGVRVNLFSTGEGIDNLVSDLSIKNRNHVHFFQPRANIYDKKRLGSHAKFCLSDGNRAYIGSANLTWPGLHTNFEMGVLVEGKIANDVLNFWKLIVEEGIIVEIFPS